MESSAPLIELLQMNARYARSLDTDRLEEWPQYFADAGRYRITSLENYRENLAGSLVYAVGQGMLKDRVQALRQANIYERQSYRHVLGMPLIQRKDSTQVHAETPFMVVRTMRTGQMDIFAAGAYVDRVLLGDDGPLLAERIVVCDSSRTDTLLAIPL